MWGCFRKIWPPKSSCKVGCGWCASMSIMKVAHLDFLSWAWNSFEGVSACKTAHSATSSQRMLSAERERDFLLGWELFVWQYELRLFLPLFPWWRKHSNSLLGLPDSVVSGDLQGTQNHLLTEDPRPMASQPFPSYCSPRAFKVHLWSLKIRSISVWFPENPFLTLNCGALFWQGPTSLLFQSFSLFVDPKILPMFLLHQSLHWMVYP